MSNQRSSTLRIRLFGELDLRWADTSPVRLGSARAESLLAYLLLHREAPQSRQRLAFLLWPDSGDQQARTNLRHLLHVVRHALPDAETYLDITPRAVRWREDAPHWLDVAAFETAADAADASTGEQGLAALRTAAGTYRRDLLEGHYEDWVLAERERLRERHRRILERLVTELATRGSHAEAVAHATRLVAHDPLREEPHRLLMALHDAAGDRARALRAYHACADVLQREVGVPPSAPTRRLYEALLAGSAAEEGRAAGPEALRAPPRVGRTEQWADLVTTWQRSEGGVAQLVVVTGEAGIGKTRLVEDLAAWCTRRGAAVATARSYAAEGSLVLAPVASWLRADAVREVLEGEGPTTLMSTTLAPATLAELARLVPELPTALPDLPGPTVASPEEQRRLLFDAVVRAIRAIGRPVLLIADDLQWADAGTLEMIHYLLRQDADAPLLVAATVREEEVEADHLHTLLLGVRRLDRLVEVRLGRLTPGETALLGTRTTGQQLDEVAAGRLFAGTDGNPLFILEAIRAGWRGDTEVPAMTPRVQSVIHERLRQLSGPAQELLGTAATIGRAFRPALLAVASGMEEDVLLGALDELWRRRLLRERDEDDYDVSHDRVREVAYAALSPSRRRSQHRRIADALAASADGDPDGVASHIAHHYGRAGAPEAIRWYARAGAAAHRLQASHEAVQLYEQALSLIRAQPQAPGRQAEELALLTAMQSPLIIVEGFGGARLARAQQKALRLADALGVPPEPPLLDSVGLADLARGDFDGARRAGELLRAGGLRDADRVRAVEGAYLLGVAAFWAGELDVARRYFQAAVEEADPTDAPTHRQWYWLEPAIVCQGRLGNTLWFLGHCDAARTTTRAAVDRADRAGHAPTLGATLAFAAVLAFDCRDHTDLRRYAQAMADQPDPMPANRIAGRSFAAYVDLLEGRTEGPMRQLREFMTAAATASHAPGQALLASVMFLQACLLVGDARAGLAAADVWLALDRNPNLYSAELHRLRGELLRLLHAPAAEVTAELRTALDVAGRQGAESLRLRAATSLLEHLRAAGPVAEVRAARDLLATIVAAIAPGGETADLQDARALLALSAGLERPRNARGTLRP